MIPPLHLQELYSHIGWAAVVVAAVDGVIRHSPLKPRRMSRALILGAAGALALVDEDRASYVDWLGLLFNFPGLLLVVLSLRSVLPSFHSSRNAGFFPRGLAAPICVLGIVLYLDAWNLLPFHVYSLGYTTSAVTAMLAVGFACLLGIAFKLIDGTAAAILVAVVVIAMITRLPTGNLWDALVDPLLWFCAMAKVGWKFADARSKRP